jgi:hypothetical protein
LWDNLYLDKGVKSSKIKNMEKTTSKIVAKNSNLTYKRAEQMQGTCRE